MLIDSRRPLTKAQLNWFRNLRSHIEALLEAEDRASIDELKVSASYRLWFAGADFDERWNLFMEMEGESK